MLAVIIALAVFAAFPSGARSAEPDYALLGKPAPFFSIRSGEDKTLVSDMVKGKVAVIFYETREASRKNSEIKDRLNILYDMQDEEVRRSIVRIPVFNCSHVVWPITVVWKKSLRYHSRRVGFTLYGDWDGRMARDYRMKENESNCLIVDRAGIIRYASFGRITERRFEEIEELLARLVDWGK